MVPPGHPHLGGLAVGLPAGFFVWVILRYPPLTPGVSRRNHAGLALFKKINVGRDGDVYIDDIYNPHISLENRADGVIRR